MGATGATNPTIQSFRYTLNRQAGVTATFPNNSAQLGGNQLTIATAQANNIANWLNVFTSLQYILTGNVLGGGPNNAPATYVNERGINVPQAVGASAGSPGTDAGLKRARANAYRNLIIGFGIPATRIITAFGTASNTNVIGRFQ